MRLWVLRSAKHNTVVHQFLLQSLFEDSDVGLLFLIDEGLFSERLLHFNHSLPHVSLLVKLMLQLIHFLLQGILYSQRRIGPAS